ncbi:MAG: hypothetical protein EOL98_15925, partial [Negativicutes bacterium]|nr:hypothetical protein [Negativicutes bacterium]
MQRITSTPLANETEPREYTSGKYMFLSDANGITNRYLAVVDSAIAFVDTIAHYRYFTTTYPLTNYARSILDFDLDAAAGYYSEIVFHDQRYYTYFNRIQDYALPASATENPLTGYMEERLRAEGHRDEIQSVTYNRIFRRFTNVYEPDLSPGLPLHDRKNVSLELDSIGFTAGIYRGDDTTYTLTVNAPLNYFSPPKKRNYNVEFSINELVTQVDFTSMNYSYQQFSGGASPIYLNAGFNVFTQVGVTDLLEDHRIIGGVKLGGDLTNNEYIINYADLSGRIDKELILHRKADEIFQQTYWGKLRNHELLYKLSYSLNRVMYVAATGILRND